MLRAMDGNAEVVLTRRGASSGADPLHVHITSARSHRLRSAGPLLERFGLEIDVDGDPARRDALELDAWGPLPDREATGRLVEELLHVAGLVDGERFRYRFDGQLDGDAMRRCWTKSD